MWKDLNLLATTEKNAKTSLFSVVLLTSALCNFSFFFLFVNNNVKPFFTQKK
jgi:hypothetical protein